MEITLNIRALKDTAATLQPRRHASLKEQLSLGLIQLCSQRSVKSVSEAGEASGEGAVSSNSERSKEFRIESFSLFLEGDKREAQGVVQEPVL